MKNKLEKKMKVSKLCRATGLQCCSWCDDFNCGDNTNETKRDFGKMSYSDIVKGLK